MPSEKLERAARANATATRQLVESCGEDLESLARLLAEKFHAGQRLVILGSGPLAALASLAANRFVYRLDLDRPSLPALALAGDGTLVSALGRDGHLSQCYARQLRTLAAAGDVVLALAGDEQDGMLREGLAEARELGCHTVLLTSPKSALLDERVDMLLVSEADSNARRDEAMLFACQLLCQLVEAELFGV